ncbi:hypothetical protein J2Z32_001226 [Paenibacillus turicensis]|uniref:Uncharacterized protein n=1 Tax=Paenibacillus turicensis TaxID=160487 RepID=A0ABS4FQI6_9BACL|nr:hypothetical protein [Paenibacillus turicensis]
MISYFFRKKHSKHSNKTKDISAVEQCLQNNVNQKIVDKSLAEHQLHLINYETYSTSRKII